MQEKQITIHCSFSEKSEKFETLIQKIFLEYLKDKERHNTKR